MAPWGHGHEGEFMVLFKRPIVDPEFPAPS